MGFRGLRGLLAAAAAMGLIFAGSVASAVPSSITYEGELIGENGLPYTGNVDVQISFWDQLSGGAMLYSQSSAPLDVDGGVLRAGIDGNMSVWTVLEDNDDIWLEFSIDGETLSPRQKLTMVPFAAQARNADRLGGMTLDMVMNQIGGATIDPATLPDDGIDDLSNGALTNQFEGVSYQWTTGVDIPDFEAGAPPESAVAGADLDVTESDTSRMYEINVQTSFTLTVESTVTMILYPPADLGIAPITLIDAIELAPAAYAQPWTPADTPALADLLDKSPDGLWSLTITDTDNTLAGNGAVGTLDAFNITYNIVRQDHLAVTGRLDVEGNANISGNTTVGGTLTVTDSFMAPDLPITVYRFLGQGNAAITGHGSVHGGAQIDFSLDRPKMVQFNFELGGDCSGANYVGAAIYLNGARLKGTSNIDTCQTYWNVGGSRTELVPAGNHTVTIRASHSGGSPISYDDVWRTRYLEAIVFGAN